MYIQPSGNSLTFFIIMSAAIKNGSDSNRQTTHIDTTVLQTKTSCISKTIIKRHFGVLQMHFMGEKHNRVAYLAYLMLN